MLKVKALLFDVFGTVVDWRTGIAREVESVAKKNDISLDPFDFADAWRAEYQPAMEEIRKGRRSFTILDILHMENLKKIASKFNLHNLSDDDYKMLVKLGTDFLVGQIAVKVLMPLRINISLLPNLMEI